MKKTLTIAAAALISASAFAQTTVTSANIVGYTKKATTAGSFSIMAPQFLAADTNGVALDDAFSGIGEGVKVFAWTGSIYNEYTYYDGYGWYDNLFNPVGDIIIEQGKAVWLKGAATTNVLMSGDVPMTASITNTLTAGFNLVGNSYPVELTLDDMPIASFSDGDKVFAWNGSIYAEYTYYVGYGWYDNLFVAAGEVAIDVGDGFWLKSAAGGDLILDKQY